jgi:broad specificity phosphatase PhoE
MVTSASAQTTVILVRHAEQIEGDDRDPSLTPDGQERARTLVHVLEGVQLDAIYSTPLKRTLETAGPVAERFGLDIVTTEPTATLVSDMGRILREGHPGQTVLVVSHSNTVPAIVNELGGGPFDQLNHTEYDSLFVVYLEPGKPTQVLRLQYGAPTQ